MEGDLGKEWRPGNPVHGGTPSFDLFEERDMSLKLGAITVKVKTSTENLEEAIDGLDFSRLSMSQGEPAEGAAETVGTEQETAEAEQEGQEPQQRSHQPDPEV